MISYQKSAENLVVIYLFFFNFLKIVVFVEKCEDFSYISGIRKTFLYPPTQSLLVVFSDIFVCIENKRASIVDH